VPAADNQALVLMRLHQAADSVRAAQRLLPKQPASGSPESTLVWYCQDILIRVKRATEAYDPPAQQALPSAGDLFPGEH
jgi:hypothetical protein